jgi:hypothetical protein
MRVPVPLSLKTLTDFFSFFFFFGGIEVWIQSFVLCKAGTLLFEPHFQFTFGLVILEDGSCELCLGRPPTSILPVSASQVARITGVSHGQPAICFMFILALCTILSWLLWLYNMLKSGHVSPPILFLLQVLSWLFWVFWISIWILAVAFQFLQRN